VFEFDISAYPTGDAASNVLYQRGVQGLIIPKQPREVEFYFRGRGWERFSIVCCSIGWIRVPFHIVTTDIFEGTRLVWRRVFERGYRRIGGAMFRHAPVAEDDYARHGGSIAQQVEMVQARDRIPLLRSHPEDKAAFLSWVERHRPDAIISFISRPYDWLTEAGYRVPNDVAFACCNIRPHEHLTGLAIQDEAIGRAAVDFLVGKINGNEIGLPHTQETLLLEPEWTEGTTLPRVDSVGGDRAYPANSRRKGRAKAGR
jgi:DNA-binding LacI/PurR family transcriptional regulator